MQPTIPIIIYNKAPEVGGKQVADYTQRARPKFTTTEYGFGEFTFECVISDLEAYLWYGWRNYWIICWWMGIKLWEGRIEQMTLTPEPTGGQRLSITAFGGIRSFLDVPYTAAWSMVEVGGFKSINDQQMVARVPDKYTMDTNNRVYIAPTKGTTYINVADLGSMTLRLPGLSLRGITQVSYTYRVNLPLNWVWRTTVLNDDFTSVTIVDTNNATGALQTGTKTLTPTGGKLRLNVEIYNNTGANYNFAAENGTSFFEITSVRIMTSAGTTLYANEIISALIDHVRGFNPTMLSPIKDFLKSPSIDLRNEVYADQYPLEIIQRMVEYGDTSGNRWEFAVWENLRCFFRVRGSGGRTWYIDAVPAIDRDMDRMHNSVYATYTDVDGDDLRTATNTANEYVTLWGGLTRQIPISADTESATQANYLRDTALLDERSGGAIGEVVVAVVYDAQGNAWPACMVRSGDTIIPRGVPVLGQDTNYVRRFIVAVTSYDSETALMTISPESRAPRLQSVEARRQNAK